MASKWVKVAAAMGLVVVSAPVAAVGWAYHGISNPVVQELPVSSRLVALDTAEGKGLLAAAGASVDYEALQSEFEAQEKATWCGVASSVIVLNALGSDLSQDAFFTDAVTSVRPWWRTTFTGMPLDQMGRMLEAHGAAVEVVHAEQSDVAAFRAAAITNLEAPGDFLVVNYDRKALEQVGGGHISPVAAYEPASDRFLVLDVSTYKYPPVWVTADDLFAAMNTPDSENGRSRGWARVWKD